MSNEVTRRTVTGSTRGLALVASAYLLSTAACSSAGAAPEVQSDGGAPTLDGGAVFDSGAGSLDAAADADAAPDPHCNSIVQQGAELPVFGSPSSPPSSRGGKVLDGTYVLTEARLYGPQYPAGPIPGASAPRTTVEVHGGTFSTLVSSTGDARASWAVTFSPATNGVALSLTCAYPSVDAGPSEQRGVYSVTDTGFILTLDAGGRGVSEQTYTKR